MFSFHSGSLLLWRISGGTSSFLGKGRQPVLVEPCCGLVSKRAGSGALLPETRSFDGKFDAVGAPSAERGRSAQACRTSAEFASENAERTAQEEAVEDAYETSTLSYGARTDTGPIALRAFWGMHVEAMNWSDMGHAEYAAALGLSPHALRIWRDRLEESGDEMDWRSLLHPSARAQLSSAANCTRRKYRLTSQAADGRSNRRRFSDEQKRAMVQETEKPGVAVAQVCRRHGIATSLLFRWRVQFGLTARKAPRLATVALADGAANEVPALAALRDLVRPPDGMMMIELEDGRRVFAPAGISPAELKRQLTRSPHQRIFAQAR